MNNTLEGVKKNIYEHLNNNVDKIECALDLVCTEKQKKDIMESLLDERNFLPNSLTLFRIPGLLLIYASIFSDNPVVIAATMASVASTDFFDGIVARKIVKNPNRGGALLDCGTDKLFNIGLIIPACFSNPLLLSNAFLEVIIGLINSKAGREGLEQKSTFLGKVKMWPLSAAILLTYVNTACYFSSIDMLTTALIALTSILEVINIVEYSIQRKNNKKLVSSLMDDEYDQNVELDLCDNKVDDNIVDSLNNSVKVYKKSLQ